MRYWKRFRRISVSVFPCRVIVGVGFFVFTSSAGSAPFHIAQGRAMHRRSQEVISINDDLIRMTLRAYGGDYVREGLQKYIVFNGTIYKDFELSIQEGKMLVLRVPHKTIRLEIIRDND